MAQDDLSERLAGYFRDAVEALNEGRAELRSWGPAVGDQRWPGSEISSGYLEEPGRTVTQMPQMTIVKASAWLPFSEELAMDAGAIPDTRPRAPWHRRARWKIARWRERAARVAYRVIAGQWPPEESYWDE